MKFTQPSHQCVDRLFFIPEIMESRKAGKQGKQENFDQKSVFTKMNLCQRRVKKGKRLSVSDREIINFSKHFVTFQDFLRHFRTLFREVSSNVTFAQMCLVIRFVSNYQNQTSRTVRDSLTVKKKAY